jgi:hypothetical protein
MSLSNWFVLKSPSTVTYSTQTGSSGTGNIYSVGASGSTERALGSIASGGNTMYIGWRFVNNTGGPISAVEISLTAEQWRVGANTTNSVAFEIGIGAAGTFTGANPSSGAAWTPYTALDLTNPIAAATAAALDGNLPANQVSFSNVLINLSTPIQAGEEFMLRWRDPDNTSADHLVAVDDLSVTFPVPSTDPLIVASPVFTPFFTTQGTPSAIQTFNVLGSNLTDDIVITAPAGFEVSLNGANSFSSSLSLTPSSGAVSSTSIDIRLSGVSGGLFTGNLAITSTGADAINVVLNGTVVAAAVTFTSGNLVALQIGNGTAALSSAATASYLREITSSGAYVQMIAMPTTDSGANQSFSNSGSASSEGALSLSPNGQYLALAGYDASPGLASVGSAAGINRVVASVNQFGEINTSTTITDGFTSNNVRGAVTSNGYDFWVSGAGTGGGVRYVTNGASTSTQISGTLTNARVVGIYDGQLYLSAQTSPNIGVSTVGTGLPTATTTASLIALTPTSTDTYGFVFLDRDAGVAGVDQLYIADNALGLLKYSFDGTTWTSQGSLTGAGFTSIAARVSGANAEIFIGSASSIYSIVDGTAYNVTLASSGSSIISTGTLIQSAAANTVFRGIAFAPYAAPECVYFQDLDNDGFGSSVTTTALCSAGAPVGYAEVSGDCNDSNNAIYPGATELACNSNDDNCNGSIDENFVTGCNDPLACNYSASATCATGCDYTAQTWYEDADTDGYGSTTVTQVACAQPLGYILTGGDCDDTNNAINPGATEDACDGIDNNCTAGIDENYVMGCQDPSALNYNPAANCTSVGCVYPSGFGQGNLVVYRLGEGSTALSSAAQRSYFDEFDRTTTGQTAIATFAVPHITAGSRLVNSGSATSEGQISRSPDGTSIVFAGYDAAVGTTSISGTSSTTTPRVIGRLSLSGTASVVASGAFYNTNNIRSAATDGTNFWAGGTSGTSTENGVTYLGPGTDAQIANSPISNVRNVRVDNNQLYFSTGSSPIGIYKVGNGLPTTSGQTATIVIPFAASTDGYDFEFNDEMTVCYVTDARTNGSGGVQKYTYNGSAWSLAYTCNVGASNGATSIYVDWFGDATPVIYATRTASAGTSLVKFVDNGTTTPTITVLATAPTNQAFRSVELAPCNGLTWYRDADGDGYGDASITMVYCSQPYGYVADNTDCNDASAVSYPGAVEICNNIDDDCDVTVDESCITPPTNDNRATAKLIQNASLYPACNNTYGDLSQCTVSPEALTSEPSGAGQDMWYRIVPTTGAIRVNVTTSSNDLMLELQDAAGTVLVSSENENGNGGTETLVANGLTIGENYYLAVRNFNTSASGSFTMCVQHFGVPTLSSSSTVNNLCSLLSQNWLGASSYTATFNDGTNDYSYTSASTKKQLSLFGLTYNQIYTLTFTSTFNVTDAAGNPTVITTTSNPVTFTVGYPQDLVVRNSDVCSSASRPLNSFIATSTTLCGLTGYEWEFVETDAGDALAGTPIYAMGNGSSRFIQLGASKIPGIQAGDYYRVKVRAVFAGGQSPWPSTYQLVCITGTAPEMTEENNEEVAWVNADASAVVYPNPNTGDMFNLNVNGLSDGVWNVQVLDVQGRIVHTEQVVAENGINRTVSLNSTLSNGLYTVRLMNGDAALNVRMIVE